MGTSPYAGLCAGTRAGSQCAVIDLDLFAVAIEADVVVEQAAFLSIGLKGIDGDARMGARTQERKPAHVRAHYRYLDRLVGLSQQDRVQKEAQIVAA